MPVIAQSTYRAPFYLFDHHLETIVPGLFRKVDPLPYVRERIETRDADFLDLDWVQKGAKKLVVLSHGLEGSSRRQYIQGMGRIFLLNGWGLLAWNCRSCSGEMNRKLKLYHHGATEDLKDVIEHVLKKYRYEAIILVGLSMGGSLSMKYLGENANNLPPAIKGGVGFSVPCDLGASAKMLSKPGNFIYRERFMKKLKRKIIQKSIQFPGALDLDGLEKIKHFPEFDQQFTAPINGFRSAEDFYTYASAGRYAEAVRVPYLLVNAANDPMLPPSCYPIKTAENSDYLFLEVSKRGGHVGFSTNRGPFNWAEQRALEFTHEVIGL